MKHLRRQCLLLLSALFCLLVSLPSCSKQKKPEELLQEAIVQQYQSVGKLLLTETTLQKAVTLQDPKISFYDISSFKDFAKWLSNQTKVGNRVGIYSFDATLVSYTDLTGFSADDVSYDSDKQQLTVYISPIQVELRGRDFTLRTEYEYVAPLRNPITPQDRARVKNRAYQVLQQEITSNDQLIAQIRQRSIEKLRRWLTQLLLSYELPPTVVIVERGSALTQPTH
ncbi:DUF4230 domain-containing protein [Porphyromonas asaccharolytica]|uniref:DUF4230 domain-containing protein n=1 Tax=Porphyromonas asaccharolytica (strain ATCC 25260 / DSM 20707 / BCRC 10618 / CCUG 7834 / JCM 6326 / LMG 13178 / VPI 4198 / B440) TaxID=879243 RepID=F4KMV0_PORAD|nr:DUF4230 domain-containing protein [Porphyromonas asaccharolytica]AEE12351.1 hypothetical protein Poras_0397 [Porphyromonas asaccharolytica DSM 20707]